MLASSNKIMIKRKLSKPTMHQSLILALTQCVRDWPFYGRSVSFCQGQWPKKLTEPLIKNIVRNTYDGLQKNLQEAQRIIRTIETDISAMEIEFSFLKDPSSQLLYGKPTELVCDGIQRQNATLVLTSSPEPFNGMFLMGESYVLLTLSKGCSFSKVCFGEALLLTLVHYIRVLMAIILRLFRCLLTVKPEQVLFISDKPEIEKHF